MAAVTPGATIKHQVWSETSLRIGLVLLKRMWPSASALCEAGTRRGGKSQWGGHGT